MEDGTRTLPAQVEIMGSYSNGAWLRIIMHEGKKRQIRKVGARIGLPVSQIKRVRIANLKLGKLKSGEWRNLTPREVYQLRRSAGLIKGEEK